MAEQLVVKESFTVEVKGTPVTYRKGELVDPDDPIIRTHQASLAVFEYPHPARRSSGVEQATSGPGEKRRR